MKKIVVSSSQEIRMSVAYRLQNKFPEAIVTTENQLTRVFALSKMPEKTKNFIYSFATEDVNMLKFDEGYFFLLVSHSEMIQRYLDVFSQVYDLDTHWRYFVIGVDGNPVKTIANVLNFDVGLVVSKVHLPKENYEYIP